MYCKYFILYVFLFFNKATLEIITKHHFDTILFFFRAVLNTKNTLVKDRMTFFKQ